MGFGGRREIGFVSDVDARLLGSSSREVEPIQAREKKDATSLARFIDHLEIEAGFVFPATPVGC
jgi:hypothetical protein